MFGLSAVTLAPSYLANNFPLSAKLVSLFPPSLRGPFGPTHPLPPPHPFRRFFYRSFPRCRETYRGPGRIYPTDKNVSWSLYRGRESAGRDFNKTLDCKVQIGGGHPDVTRVSEVQSVPFLPARSPPMTAYLKRKFPLRRYR